MATLRDLKTAGKTILIVHHDLSKVPSYFDQVMILNRELIAFGPTERVFVPQELKRAYGASLIIQGGAS